MGRQSTDTSQYLTAYWPDQNNSCNWFWLFSFHFSPNTRLSSKLVQSSMIIWMLSGMKSSKQDFISCTWVTAIRFSGSIFILITLAVILGGSFPGQKDHSYSHISSCRLLMGWSEGWFLMDWSWDWLRVNLILFFKLTVRIYRDMIFIFREFSVFQSERHSFHTSFSLLKLILRSSEQRFSLPYWLILQIVLRSQAYRAIYSL